MNPEIPFLSTDLLAAFVALVEQGSISGAARTLGITEQGLRNRLARIS